MKITLEMIDRARRAEFDDYQRGRQVGAGRGRAAPELARDNSDQNQTADMITLF
jgi:hypothetical protein